MSQSKKKVKPTRLRRGGGEASRAKSTNGAKTTPVRIPADVVEEADKIADLSSDQKIRLTRADVITAAARGGMPSIRDTVEAAAKS